MGRIVLLFVVVPIVEMMLLIRLGEYMGFWPTIGLILATGMLGSYLARREGLSAWQRLQQKLRSGGMPGTELVDGVIILVAGALLITPGVLTDIVGMLGLLPLSRTYIRSLLLRRVERGIAGGAVRMHVWGMPGMGRSAEHPPARPGDGEAQPAATSWQGTARERPNHRAESA